MAMDKGYGQVRDLDLDEEEKRRRRMFQQLVQPPKPQTPTPAASRPNARGAAQVSEKRTVATFDQNLVPRAYFEQKAAQAKQTLNDRRQKTMDNPMEEFQYLRKQWGEQGLKKRMQDMELLARSYMAPNDIAPMVWDLTRSPYTVEDVETMLSRGHTAMFGVSSIGSENIIPKRLFWEMGMDPTNLPENVAMYYPGLFLRGLNRKSTTDERGFWDKNIWTPAREAWEWIEKPFAQAQVGNTLAHQMPRKFNPGEDGLSMPLRPPEAASRPVTEKESQAYQAILGATAMLMPVGAAFGTAARVAGAGAKAAAWGARGTKVAHMAGVGGLMNAGDTMEAPEGASLAERAQIGATNVVGNVFTGAVAPVIAAQKTLGSADESLAEQAATSAHQANLMYQQSQSHVPAGELTRALEAALVWHGQELNSLNDVVNLLKQEQVDEDGNIIRDAYLDESVVYDGTITDEIADGVRKAYSDFYRSEVERRRQAIEAGFARNHPNVSAPLDDPEWRSIMLNMDKAYMAQQKRFNNHPVLATILDVMGVPISKEDWNAFGNRMISEGLVQAPVKVMIEGTMAIGEAWRAMLAGTNLLARQQKDPIYQAKAQALQEALRAKKGETHGELLSAASYGRGYAVALYNQSQDLQADPEIAKLREDVKTRTMELIDMKWGADAREMFALAFTDQDIEETAAWSKANSEMTESWNLILDVGLLVAGGPGRKALKKGSTVPHDYIKAANHPRFRASAEGVVEDIMRNDPGAAQSKMGGVDAAGMVEFLRVERNGRLNSSHPLVVDLTTRLVDTARTGNVDAVQALLPGKDRALAEQMVKRVDAADKGLIDFAEAGPAKEAKKAAVLQRAKEQTNRISTTAEAGLQKRRATDTAAFKAKYDTLDAKGREKLDKQLDKTETARNAAEDKRRVKLDETLSKQEQVVLDRIKTQRPDLYERALSEFESLDQMREAAGEYTYTQRGTAEQVSEGQWYTAGRHTIDKETVHNKLGNELGEGVYLTDNISVMEQFGEARTKMGKAEVGLHYVEASLEKVLDADKKLAKNGKLTRRVREWAEANDFPNIVEALDAGTSTMDVYRGISRRHPGNREKIAEHQAQLDGIIRELGYDAKRATYETKGGGKSNIVAVIDPKKLEATRLFKETERAQSAVENLKAWEDVSAWELSEQRARQTAELEATFKAEREAEFGTADMVEARALSKGRLDAELERAREEAALKLEEQHGEYATGERARVQTRLDQVNEKARKRWADIEQQPLPDPRGAHERVGDLLVERQKAKGDVFEPTDIKANAVDYMARRYAEGDDIFPHLSAVDLPGPQVIREGIAKVVSNIKDDNVRILMGRITANIFAVGQKEAAIGSQKAPNGIFAWVYQLTGDSRVASDFRNRYLRAVGNGRNANMLRDFIGDIQVLIGENVVSERSGRHTPALAPHPRTGKLQGAYRKGGVERQPAPDTSYRLNAIPLGRDMLLAKRLVKSEWAGWLKALTHVTNVERQIHRNLNVVGAPMRKVAVSVGAPLLAVKHLVTDYGIRTNVDEGFGATLLRPKVRKDYEAIIKDADGALAAELQTRHHASELGDFKYQNLGSKDQKTGSWHVDRAFDDQGRPQNVAGAGHAWRRIARGDIFRAWAKDGEAGVRKWLESPEGHSFLGEEGHLSRTELRGLDAKGKQTLSEKEIYQLGIDEFVSLYVNGIWEVLQVDAPLTMKRAKEMSLNNEQISDAAMAKTIVEVNNGRRPDQMENPALSLPEPARGENRYTEAANFIIGHAMVANKMSRNAVYEHMFVDHYKMLVKDGMKPENAMRVAASVAELKTARTHFDLSSMVNLEARWRWAAWFATKHRLWGTWMLRTSAQKPVLAAAALDIADWMEARNEEEPNEWDRHKLIVNVGGNIYKNNVATLAWLLEYPSNSTMGNYAEQASIGMLNMIPGVDLHTTPTPFGMGLLRGESQLRAVQQALSSPAMSFSSDTFAGEVTPEKDAEIEKWLEDMDADQRKYWYPKVHMQRALASHRNEEITTAEAVRRALVSQIGKEAWSLGRPLSMTWESEDQHEIEMKLKELEDIAPGPATWQFLEDNPEVAMLFNLSLNPYEKTAQDEAIAKYSQNRDALGAEMNLLYDQGKIYDQDLVKATLNKYDRIVESWTTEGRNYDEAFVKWYGRGEKSTLTEALGGFLPGQDIGELLERATVPDQKTMDQVKAQLTSSFEDAATARGIVVGRDQTTEAYKLLHYAMVELPLAKITGFEPRTGLPYREERVAGLLERGETGATKAAGYLRGVEARQGLTLYRKGITDGNASERTPFMATLTGGQKHQMGWETTPVASMHWFVWSQRKHDLRAYQLENSIPSNSKEGKRLWAEFQKMEAGMAEKDPVFKKELEFSKLPLHERLAEAGVANPKTPEGQGWGAFLNILNDMHGEMDRLTYKSGWTTKTGVTTLKGANAGEINDRYLYQVVQLRDQYPEWWDDFINTFSIRNFGFYGYLGGDQKGLDTPLWNAANEEEEIIDDLYN